MHELTAKTALQKYSLEKVFWTAVFVTLVDGWHATINGKPLAKSTKVFNIFQKNRSHKYYRLNMQILKKNFKIEEKAVLNSAIAKHTA